MRSGHRPVSRAMRIATRRPRQRQCAMIDGSPERLMVVLHLCGGPHVGVDHSADVALVAGSR